MKWSNEQKEQLKELCYAGTPNAELAKLFEVPAREIHAMRSALGITIPKCKAGKPGVRTTEEILKEAQEVQTVMKRVSDLMDACDDRLHELKTELRLQDAGDMVLKIVLDGMAYEFADAEEAHEALSAAADNWETEEDDGVYELREMW